MDLALGEDIDMHQYRYFANVVEQRMGDTDQAGGGGRRGCMGDTDQAGGGGRRGCMGGAPDRGGRGAAAHGGLGPGRGEAR